MAWDGDGVLPGRGGGDRPVGEEQVDRWDLYLPGRDGGESRERGGGISRIV